ncbi:hypothetical protein MPER_05942, partial [Moniliophthora perniciosa FA553]
YGGGPRLFCTSLRLRLRIFKGKHIPGAQDRLNFVNFFPSIWRSIVPNINRHPVEHGELQRIIESRFTSSTFSKHAFEESGETSLRSSTRRSPRKAEKKPVYVLNLVIPRDKIDNLLEPAK